MKRATLLAGSLLSSVSHFSYAEEKAILDYDTAPNSSTSSFHFR